MTDTIKIEIDIAHDCPIGEALDLIQRHNGQIFRFIANGLGGGNPTLFLQFPHYNDAENFLQEYCEDSDVESYEI